jgi:hypothetical protein
MRQFVKYSGVIVVTLILAGCGGLFKADAPLSQGELILGQDGRTLWEAGLQYVRVVNQDIPSLPNEHPVALTSEELRAVLGEIYVSERIAFREQENPLFSVGELQILSTTIASGLGQAAANEDVDFVSIGVHPAALADEQKTNSGKVFMSGGRLNIIFGLIHEIYRDKDVATGQPVDRRLHPLLPGTRRADSGTAVNVTLDSGQSFYLDPDSGKERTDWLVLDIATVLQKAKERAGDGEGLVSPELLEDVARNKQETGNLRHDVSNIKEILFELSDDIEELKQQIEELSTKP